MTIAWNLTRLWHWYFKKLRIRGLIRVINKGIVVSAHFRSICVLHQNKYGRGIDTVLVVLYFKFEGKSW